MQEDAFISTPILPRYFFYELFEQVFLDVVKTISPDFYTFSYLGSSVENRSIYGIKLGHGNFKILAWSQMHGNESTTTRALIELLQDDNLQELLSGISLYIIPVLNPDGLQAWTRNNANNVDLNRDAQELSQPESLILKDAIDFFEPDLALNLHGQRTIFGVANSSMASQVSFLVPAFNTQKDVNDNRVQAMHLVTEIDKTLKLEMKAAIGRYDDTFNPACWGDYCQSNGIPTILFEAGHNSNDYDRTEVKGLILSSLKTVLRTAAVQQAYDTDSIVFQYESIPPVIKNYTDILLRNVPTVTGIKNVAIMYYEQPTSNGRLEFIPMIYAINDSTIMYGHRVIDVSAINYYDHDLFIFDDHVVYSESLKISSFTK